MSIKPKNKIILKVTVLENKLINYYNLNYYIYLNI